MKRKFIYFIVALYSLNISSQEVNYDLANFNYFNFFHDGGGKFINSSELGMWANYNAKQSVAFREFKTNGDNSGDTRNLQVGDIFTLQVYASSAYGSIGFSLLSNPANFDSWNSRHSEQRLYVQVDGNYGSWYVNSANGNQSLNYNVSGNTYRDYMFKVFITSNTTCDVELYVSGSYHSRLSNLTMNGTSGANISHFALYLNDDWNGSSNANIYWKQPTSHEASDLVKLGQDLSFDNYNPGLITDGLSSSSSVTQNSNNIEIYGSNGYSVIFDESNTYTGSTTIKSGGKLKLLNNLPNSDILVETGGELVISGENIEIKSLNVQDGATVTMSEGNGLRIENDLYTDGLFSMSSSSTEYSSLIVEGNSSGDITYDRYVNEYSDNQTDNPQWDLVGSPVEGQPIDLFAIMNAQSGNLVTAPNLNDGSTYYGIGPFDNSLSSGWPSVYDSNTIPSTNFPICSGYQMATVSGGAVLTFSGSLASVPQTKTITDNSSSGGTQWNLIANPFPSYLNLNSAADATNNFITENGLSVYGWSATTSGYTVYNNVSPTPDASYIAPGQGFFVGAGNGTTSVNFTAGMRTTLGGDDFVAGRLSGSYTYFYLDMLNQNGNSIDNSMFYFDDNMTHGYDQGYDAESFDQSSSLMSRLLNGYEGIGMQVNAMPTSSLDDSTIVSLDINRLAGTAFTISLGDSFNIPADVDIYLEDREEQTFTDLKNGDFSITPTTNLSGTGRFYLVFGTNSLGSDDFDMSHINAYKPFNADHLVIEGLFNIETASVSMYNIIGQEVLNVKLNANQAIEKVSTLGMNAGVYIVNIQADNNTITKKIIIN